LNNDILNSTVFRKDVINSTSAGGGLATCDFSNTDLITLSISDSVNISFTGLENGDVKYLYLTKPINKSVTFSAATEVTPFIKNITDLKTSVLYRIFSKNGLIFIKAVIDTLPEANVADITSANAYKIPTAKAVFDYVTIRDAAIISYVDAEVLDLETNKVSKSTTQPFTITETTVGATISGLTSRYNILNNIFTISATFTLSYSGSVSSPEFLTNINLPNGSTSLFIAGGSGIAPAIIGILQLSPLKLKYYGTVLNTDVVKIFGSIPLI
jgi:hypothetical protein